MITIAVTRAEVRAINTANDDLVRNGFARSSSMTPTGRFSIEDTIFTRSISY